MTWYGRTCSGLPRHVNQEGNSCWHSRKRRASRTSASSGILRRRRHRTTYPQPPRQRLLLGPCSQTIHDHTGQDKQDVHDAMCELFLDNQRKQVGFLNILTGGSLEVPITKRSSGLKGDEFFNFVERCASGRATSWASRRTTRTRITGGVVSDAPFRRRRSARAHDGTPTEDCGECRRLHTTRDYVFARERHVCRCCQFRHADTMHELIPRSIGGKRSASNSVAVCGDGVRGCHGFLQRHEIKWTSDGEGAEGTLLFTAMTRASARWVEITLGDAWRSPKLPFYEPDGC